MAVPSAVSDSAFLLSVSDPTLVLEADLRLEGGRKDLASIGAANFR